MDHSEEYKGHHISVSTMERRKGTYTWEYQIDAGPIRTGSDRPLPGEELMLKEGLREARSAVDRMVAAKSG